MTRYINTLLLFIVGMSIHLNAQSLDEYLKIAAANNPLLKAKYAEFEAALQKITQAHSLPDPSLSFGYFISPVETRVGPQKAKIGLSQMFPWFGSLKIAGKVMGLQAESKYQESVNARNELFMQVKSVWYPLFEVNKKILLQKENRELLSTYKRLATTGFKNNKASLSDVIRVDIMIEHSDTEIKLLEEQLVPLTVSFNKLLNRDEMLPISMADTLTLLDIPAEYRKDSLSIHPMLQSLDIKLQSAQQTEELAKKQGLPKFGVGVDYVFVNNRTDMAIADNGKNALMPMISMSIPIYRKKYKASTKQAQLNQEAIIQHKVNLENQFISNYQMAWYDLEKSKILVNSYQVQTEKTNQLISLLESMYSNSGEDFEEILRMQQELLKYQMAEATAIKTFYTALARLDYLTAKSE